MYIGIIMKIKAVLFDLDGTLVNSLADLADSVNFTLQEFGFATHENEKFKYFIGDGMQKLIERVLPDDKKDNDSIKQVLSAFMCRYREHFADKTVAYDGIYELVNSLDKMNLKLAIVSNKAQDMAVEVTNKVLSGLNFDIICGKREGYPTKPDPTLTLEIINELGVKPSECIFIGDSGMDMAVAKNAKVIGIGVLWGFRTEAELLENGADYIVNNPNEIAEIIKDINL